MIKKLDSIILSSQDPKKLADFYGEKVGLSLIREMEMGDNASPVFEFGLGNGSPALVIMEHSKVKTKNNTPERVMLNLEVVNIEKEVKKLDEAGVEKIQDIYHIEEYGQVATFADIDGNYFQLVQIRPSK